MKKKFKKGSKVKIIAGNFKGQESVVLDLLMKKDKYQDKILVSDINICSRHIKPKSNEKGKIVKKEMPIHISNVRLIQE